MNRKIIIPFDTKAVSDVGEFEGYGAIFGNIDLGNDIIEKGAFVDSLKQHKQEGQLPSMFWDHNTSLPIGDYQEIREDDKGLYVKGVLWVEGNSAGQTPIPEAALAHNMMRGTGKKGLSVGYNTIDSTMETRDEERVRLLKKLDVWEISPTVFAMNPKASVSGVKKIDDFSIRTVERALRDMGLSKKEAKSLLSHGYKGMHWDDADESGLDAELKAMLKNELTENNQLKELL